MKMYSINPAKNYTILGSVTVSTKQDIKQKVARAQKAKLIWKNLGVKKRIALLRPILAECIKRQNDIAHLITKETGKAITESRAHITISLEHFKWFLDHGESALADVITFEDKHTIHKITYEPYGIAAVIVPWNFPFLMFVWGVIPQLIAGNTVIFKHAEECPLTGKLLERIVRAHTLPTGVFSEIYGDGKIGELLVQEPINLIWFTGSSKVGKKLYRCAGKKFIKTILELGGSNPTIVFDDICIDDIIEKIFVKRFSHCGQICIALKRLIIHKRIFDTVVEKLKNIAVAKIVGDPESLKTDMGSLVNKHQLELLESQVADALKKGALIVTGGKRPSTLKGAYYLPTILTNIKRTMRVWREETFGPVLPIISFKTEKEAIKIANDTRYGLAAQVYTKNRARALRVASQLEAGAIDINGGNHMIVCNPFGGYKESGIGRELGIQGFHEVSQIKVLAIEKA